MIASGLPVYKNITKGGRILPPLIIDITLII